MYLAYRNDYLYLLSIGIFRGVWSTSAVKMHLKSGQLIKTDGKQIKEPNNFEQESLQMDIRKKYRSELVFVHAEKLHDNHFMFSSQDSGRDLKQAG